MTKSALLLAALLALGGGVALSGDGNGGGSGASLLPTGASCSSSLTLAKAAPEDSGRGAANHLPECKGAHCPWLLVSGDGNGGGNGAG